jgi:hypothetical protein
MEEIKLFKVPDKKDVKAKEYRDEVARILHSEIMTASHINHVSRHKKERLIKLNDLVII